MLTDLSFRPGSWNVMKIDIIGFWTVRRIDAANETAWIEEGFVLMLHGKFNHTITQKVLSLSRALLDIGLQAPGSLYIRPMCLAPHCQYSFNGLPKMGKG